MFIDMHAHAYWKHPPLWVQFCTPEQLIERYDKAGIEKGVVLLEWRNTKMISEVVFNNIAKGNAVKLLGLE